MMNNIKESAIALENKNFLLNEEMSKHTSFKTGGKADFFTKINNLEELKFVLDFSKEIEKPLFILGNGSNILVRDKGIRGIVCQVGIDKFEIEEKGDNIFVCLGSGSKNAIVSTKLLNLGIEGFEFASRNTTELLEEL